MIAWVLFVIYGTAFLYAWGLTQVQLHTPLFNQSKMYSRPNVNSFDERKPLIFFNMICVFLTAAVVSFFAGSVFTFSMTVPWWSILLQILFMATFDDLWFYSAHRLMHENKWLFRHVHSIHHRVRSPLPLDYIYVHPFEWMFGGMGIPVGFAILYFSFGPISAYAMFIFLGFKAFHEINIHSGLKSWVLERHPWKFIGSSEHHGDHHNKFRGNYASSFKWLDKFFQSRVS